MVIHRFEFARCPRILFGTGAFTLLAGLAAGFGANSLLLTGAGSLAASGKLATLQEALEANGVAFSRVTVSAEPSPEGIDEVAGEFRGAGIDVVIAVGGGSVIDAGKAVSAMLLEDAPVVDYLEGVGDPSAFSGRRVPLIAVPTTAGTGTEATKNAVLSRLGPGGFKKSLRHDSLVPDAAVVDPLLTIDCPRELTAACGMDAFTQLLESYVSTGSSPVTDALALSGMSAVGDSLLAAWESGSDVEARGGMSYAALMSGIALANAGLGVVHGIAAVVGGLFEAPHGAVCGTLVGEATRFNIDALRRSGKAGSAALEKYGSAGSVLSGCPAVEVDACCDSLLDLIDGWVERLRLPLLGEYGVTPRDAEHIAAQAEIKSNPAPLGLSEVRDILLKRI